METTQDFQQPQCAFILQRHPKRQCRFPALPGSQFCGTHSSDPSKHVPCPRDPSHLVKISKLQRHLNKCRSSHPRTGPGFTSISGNDATLIVENRRYPLPASFVKDVNHFSCAPPSPIAPPVFTDAELIEKIKTAYSTMPPIPMECMRSAALESLSVDPSVNLPHSVGNPKHFRQVWPVYLLSSYVFLLGLRS